MEPAQWAQAVACLPQVTTLTGPQITVLQQCSWNEVHHRVATTLASRLTPDRRRELAWAQALTRTYPQLLDDHGRTATQAWAAAVFPDRHQILRQAATGVLQQLRRDPAQYLPTTNPDPSHPGRPS